ncbi:MAG: M23 family metallopeptidase [Lentisphaerae bacterium]|nr:M23 family metallopeptidase [Lentisphaerota bacterium]
MLLLVLLIIFLAVKCRRRAERREMEVPMAEVLEYSPFFNLIYPTEHDLLDGIDKEGVFQPVRDGRPGTPFYGTTRIRSSKAGPIPSFHEGIDIAPAKRNRSGKPLDVIRCIADGTIAHIARSPGGSTYGCYVVVIHDDPVGPIYSLYAHLSEVDGFLVKDQKVSAGDSLGVMGNTATYNISMARAHLHLEIGVLMNSEFGAWAKKNGIKPDRGNYNGWNLQGVDPLGVYRARSVTDFFAFGTYLSGVPVAFELVIKTDSLPNYFLLYPRLWTGQEYAGGAIVVALSEGAVPLSGRNATLEESKKLSRQSLAVPQNVNESVLGGNGRRVIVKRRGNWELGSAASQWLDIFLY